MRRRDLLIALEHAHGKTYSQLAEIHSLSIPRIGQICSNVGAAVRKELDSRYSGPQEIGLYIQRVEFFWSQFQNGIRLKAIRPPGAEMFHMDLRRERRADIEAMHYHGN